MIELGGSVVYAQVAHILRYYAKCNMYQYICEIEPEIQWFDWWPLTNNKAAIVRGGEVFLIERKWNSRSRENVY